MSKFWETGMDTVPKQAAKPEPDPQGLPRCVPAASDPVLGWRVWYDDGSCISSRESSWDELPDDGVIFVMLYEKRLTPAGLPMRRSMSGIDHYFRVESGVGVVYGSNNDPRAEIERRYPGAVILRGKWTRDDIMSSVNDEAQALREF